MQLLQCTGVLRSLSRALSCTMNTKLLSKEVYACRFCFLQIRYDDKSIYSRHFGACNMIKIVHFGYFTLYASILVANLTVLHRAELANHLPLVKYNTPPIYIVYSECVRIIALLLVQRDYCALHTCSESPADCFIYII